MAEIVLTTAEHRRICRIADELDLTAEEFLADARPALAEGEWALLAEYAAACVRQVLEVGAVLHAMQRLEGACGTAHPGRGCDSFRRAALAAWRDAFSPIAEPWRLAEILEKVPGGEKRVLADIATLEAMAANRMFDTLDDQAARLLG